MLVFMLCGVFVCLIPGSRMAVLTLSGLLTFVYEMLFRNFVYEMAACEFVMVVFLLCRLFMTSVGSEPAVRRARSRPGADVAERSCT
jgi:hypothetical protein